MSLYDEMIEGGIDVHCHIDFEFSAKERKREPEFLWLPKAEAMGMRGVVLKSHWWPTINVVPYILSSVRDAGPFVVQRRAQQHSRRSQPMHHRILRSAWRQNGFSSDLERAQRCGTQRL